MAKTKGATDLRRWREKAGLSQVALAEAIGGSQTCISHYESGFIRPDSTTREVIRAVTDGAVSPESWLTPAEVRRIAAARPVIRPAA